MRPPVVVALLLAVAAAAPLLAKWSVDVQVRPELKQVKTVAVQPIENSTGVDYLEIEKELASELSKHFSRVVDAATVRQKLFETKGTLSTPEGIKALLQAVDAGALVIPSGANAATSHSGGTMVQSGTTATFVQEQLKEGDVRLSIVDPDGTLLLQGQGHGESRNPWRSDKGMISKLHRLILEKAFAQ